MNLIRGQDWKRFLLSAEGRITRRDYWLGFGLTYVFCIMVATIIDIVLADLIGVVFVGALVVLGFLYPSVVIAIKRCHDRGRSGWFLLLALLPFLNVWVIVELAFLRGTVGPNKYGEDTII